MTVAWLILRAFNQRNLLPHLARAAAPGPQQAPKVTIIVPARDEAANIGRCLDSLLAQNYPADRRKLIIVDDHSADDTAAIVRRIAVGKPQLSLLASPPLPQHWTGKTHACWIGACAAAPDSEWLCFVDADVWGDSALLASAMAAALRQRLDLLSAAPRQELKSFAERLILPCGLMLLSFVQDLRKSQAPSSADVTATGQFMLIRRAAYEAAGGHAAVAGAICEDLELARRVKKSGRSVLLTSAEDLASTRMYTGWRTLWPGLTKNLVDTLGGRRATLIIAPIAAVLACAAVALPALDAVAYARGVPDALAALIAALIGSSAAFALHIAAARHFCIPLYYGFLFPLGYILGALMAFDGVRRRLRGRVSWKGRIYS